MSQFTPQPGFEPSRPESGTESFKRYEPVKPENPLRALLSGLALKFKSIALVVFKLKIFATSATMLVSVAAYA